MKRIFCVVIFFVCAFMFTGYECVSTDAHSLVEACSAYRNTDNILACETVYVAGSVVERAVIAGRVYSYTYWRNNNE